MSIVVSNLEESSLANCARGKDKNLGIKKKEIKNAREAKIHIFAVQDEDKMETRYWSSRYLVCLLLKK